MTMLRRYKVKQWIYRSIVIGGLIFLVAKLEEKDTVDVKTARSTDNDGRSRISSNASSVESSKTTYRYINLLYLRYKPLQQSQLSASGIERPKIIQKMCRTLKVFNKWSYLQLHGRLLLDRSLYYCDIPKCGSAFMEQFLSGTFQCNGLCDEILLTSGALGSEPVRLINDAYSFMFVREPYGRLFAAYENKLFLPNEHWKIIGTDVIKTVRPHASYVSKTFGHDVTFLELVQYVINLYERGIRLNDHLIPMYMLCDTCDLRFNFIGKLETMSSDLVELVEDWKVKGILSKNFSSANEIEAKMLYKRSFGPFRHMVTALRQYGEMLSRYKFFQRSWSNYQIRGLIHKKYPMPFTETEVAKVKYSRFGAEIKKAMDKSKKHKEELKAQREEALVQAYSSVPFELMMKLREFMKPDCLLFGYDYTPSKLFDRQNSSRSNFDYFKGL